MQRLGRLERPSRDQIAHGMQSPAGDSPLKTPYAVAVKITEAELLRKIATGEDSHTEIRAELPDDDTLARTLCAFANTRGGVLIVGANQDRTLCGCSNPKDALTRIRLVAEEDLKPAVNLAMSSVRCKSEYLIVVQVGHSFDRPHSVPCSKRKRDIMVRVGTANHVAEGGTLNALRSHRTQEQPKDALEVKILEWVAHREQDSKEPSGSASPEIFCKAANIGLRRASKAFVSLECAGLLMGYGDRSHRFYALP